MGKKIKNPREILENCFSNLDWEFLNHHPDFKIELQKGCQTLDDVERLSVLGDGLLLKRDTASANTLKSPVIRHGKRR